MRKTWKRGVARAIASLLAVATIGTTVAFAAGPIDITGKYQINVNMATTDYPELKEADIPNVSLYQIATVDVTQKYTPTELFEDGIDLTDLDKLGTDDAVVAQQWLDIADDVADIVDQNAETAEVISVPVIDGAFTKDELVAGLYLVKGDEFIVGNYKYEYDNFIVAVPGYDETTDAWMTTGTVYINAKISKTLMRGEIEITKNLKHYLEVAAGDRTDAFFVYTIQAFEDEACTKLAKDATTGRNVYDDVTSISLSAASSDTVTIEDLPLGYYYKITEIYDGSSYKAEDEVSKTVYLDSSNDTLRVEETDDTITYIGEVSFINSYDGGTKGGHGVLNTFKQGIWFKNGVEQE